jgi:hypothetical protein
MNIQPTPGGARFLNFDPEKQAEADAFIKRAAKELFGSKPEGRAFDGGYIPNNWAAPEGRYGQQYMPHAAPVDRPKLAATYDASMPQIAGQLKTLDQLFAKEHGFTLSPHLQEMRAAIASDGRAGIAMLVKRLGLGAAAVAPMLSAAERLGLLAPQGTAIGDSSMSQ